jgi:putative FmdB family regulatory protein
MPLYEYRCEACGSTFEKIRKFSDPPLEVCEKCGMGPVRKLISSPAIQFKGSGWYITDYAKKSSTDSGEAKAATEKSEKSETTKTESTTTDTSKTSTKKDA